MAGPPFDVEVEIKGESDVDVRGSLVSAREVGVTEALGARLLKWRDSQETARLFEVEGDLADMFGGGEEECDPSYMWPSNPRGRSQQFGCGQVWREAVIRPQSHTGRGPQSL
jgi:hypothetical protein